MKYKLKYYENGEIISYDFERLKDDIIDEEYFNVFNLLLSENDIILKRKLSKLKNFQTIAQVHEGIHTGNIRNKLFIDNRKTGNEKPLYYGGKNGDVIDNYFSKRNGWFVDYRKEIIEKNKGEYASLREEYIFNNPKIYITRTGNPFKCFIDTNNYASNNFFSFQLKDLNKNSIELLSVFVCILNSKFAQYYIRKIIAPRLGNSFVETKIIHLLKLPLPKGLEQNAVDFYTIVNRAIEQRKSLINLSGKFQRSLQREFSEELEKLPKKLQNWYELSFANFVKELNKKKAKLSLSQKAEWEDYFLAEQQKALDLQAKINVTDKGIDQMVYELYGLTDEEIEVVENS